MLSITRYMAWCHHVITQNDATIGVPALRDPWGKNSHTSGPMKDFCHVLVGYSLCIGSAVSYWTEAIPISVNATPNLGEPIPKHCRL